MLKKQIFGLDISDHSIEALLLSKSFFGKPTIKAYARTILRGEVVKNGVIKKPDKLAENIVKLLNSAKPKEIKTPYCIISLPESQVFTTIFKLPAGLKYNEIKNTIPFKAEEVIPFKSSEIYFDFQSIGSKGNTQEVFYVAVPIKVVDAYLEVFQNIDLVPVAFDLESKSLARSLLAGSKKEDQAKLLIDIGARTTNLNIFDANAVRANLSLSVAGDRFTKAIAKKFNLKPKEANELKMKNGFDPGKQKGKVLLVLQNEFKRVINETKKLIDYYQSQSQRQVGKVILAGGSSLLPQIDQYLADNLGLEVNIGNPFNKISDPKSLVQLKEKSVLFSNVAGLALRGLDKNPVNSDINLLPVVPQKFSIAPAKEEKKAWLKVYIRLTVLLILVALLVWLIIIRQKGQDVYQTIVNSPDYETNFSSEIDFEMLAEIRNEMLAASSTATTTATTTEDLTPTSTEPVIETIFNVQVRPNSLGYLNVRRGPGTGFEKITQVLAGEKYSAINTEGDWFEIKLDEESTGWVYSIYVDKLE